MFSFYELDLSAVWPFQPGARIAFKNGVNQVSGEHLSGKTRLFEQLRASALAFLAAEDTAARLAPPEPLMFWSDHCDLPMFWRPYPPLADLIQPLRIDREQLASDFQFAFEQVLSDRNAVLSGAYGGADSFPEFRYAVSEAGQLELTNAVTGNAVTGVLSSHTERCAIYLALNWALRRRIPGGQIFPFVIDDQLGAMDSLLLDNLSQLLRAISRQVIVIGRPSTLVPDIAVSHCMKAEDVHGYTVVAPGTTEYL
ncbi:MAG: hypothetical protein K0Q68_318 [Moraxellaceae bacterium]|jgi:hypothetical protein|nr:hypothetical protein [Moraxellaceae bacterium]